MKKVFLQDPEEDNTELPTKSSFSYLKFKNNLNKYRGCDEERVIDHQEQIDNFALFNPSNNRRIENIENQIEEEKNENADDENPFEVNITSIPYQNKITPIEEPDLSFIENRQIYNDQLSDSDIEIHEQISNSLSKSKTCSWNKSSNSGFKVRDDYEEQEQNKIKLANNYVTFGISRKGRITIIIFL